MLDGEPYYAPTSTQLGPASRRGRLQAVEQSVVVQRVVMKKQQALDLGPAREGQRIGQARVPPTDVGLVLLVRVLGVMNEHGRPAGEFEA